MASAPYCPKAVISIQKRLRTRQYTINTAKSTRTIHVKLNEIDIIF
jgi:hypothetical protein